MRLCSRSVWLLVAVLLGGLWTGPALAQVPPDSLSAARVKKSIKAVLGTGHSVTWTSVPLSAADKKAIRPTLKGRSGLPDSLYFGFVSTKKGERFLIPDVTPSKSKTFSLLLYLDGSGTVIDVDVLKYRENYGYEVDYSLFRRQFQGKADPREVRFRRTIQNISGATISARSMTYSVHDLLAIVDHLGLSTIRPPAK